MGAHAREQRLDIGDEAVRHHVRAADVHAQVAAGRQIQLGQVIACQFEHMARQVIDDVVFLGRGDEQVGPHIAQPRVAPAQQRPTPDMRPVDMSMTGW